MTALPAIAQRLADELRRLPCRFAHGVADISKCPRCVALAEYTAFTAIVQTPKVAAQAALRAVADSPGERHD